MNPWLTGFPWSAAANYAAGPDTWDGTPTKHAPAYVTFQPKVANAPTAQELNYLENQITNAILYNAIHGLVAIQTKTVGNFVVTSAVGSPITGLSLAFTGVLAGDMFAVLMGGNIDTANNFYYATAIDTGGTLQGVSNCQAGSTTAPLRAGAVGLWTCGAVGGGGAGTTTFSGAAFYIGAAGQITTSTLTVIQFRVP